MIEFLLMFALFLVALAGLWLALQFSGYKKRRGSACCGGGHCASHIPEKRDHACCKENPDALKVLKQNAI